MPRLGGDDESEDEDDEKNEKKSKTVEKLSDGKQQKAGPGPRWEKRRWSWCAIPSPLADFMATEASAPPVILS